MVCCFFLCSASRVDFPSVIFYQYPVLETLQDNALDPCVYKDKYGFDLRARTICSWCSLWRRNERWQSPCFLAIFGCGVEDTSREHHMGSSPFQPYCGLLKMKLNPCPGFEWAPGSVHFCLFAKSTELTLPCISQRSQKSENILGCILLPSAGPFCFQENVHKKNVQTNGQARLLRNFRL